MSPANGDIPLNPSRSRSAPKARRSDLPFEKPSQRRTKGQKAPGLHVVKKTPLSKLAGDRTPILIEQMKDWILRSLEKRIQEAKEREKVPRPMNSFFIYLSMYVKVIKSHFGVENHQLVNQIAGASWGAENEAFKKQFKDMAKSERQRHALANPEYKFQPQSRQSSSLGKPTAQLQSNGFPENDGEWFHSNGRETTTLNPVYNPSWGYDAGGIHDASTWLFVSEPETRLQSYGFSESDGEWSHSNGSETIAPSPVNNPSWGCSVGGIQDDTFVATGESFETYSCSGLVGIPCPGNCDLMSLDAMKLFSFPAHLSDDNTWGHQW